MVSPDKTDRTNPSLPPKQQPTPATKLSTPITNKPNLSKPANPANPATTGKPPSAISTKPTKTKPSLLKLVKKWILRLFILLVLVGVAYLAYYFKVWQWFDKATAPLTSTVNINKTQSATTADLARDAEIKTLKQQLNELQKHLQKSQRQNLLQQRRLIDNIQQQQLEQKRQLINMAQQISGIHGQFNRWKKQLAKPEKLIDNILKNLNLIQTQSLLNYSPALLAKQLSVIDLMLEELNIEELALARVELQQLISELDLKPIAPVEFWLQEIELSKRSEKN